MCDKHATKEWPGTKWCQGIPRTNADTDTRYKACGSQPSGLIVDGRRQDDCLMMHDDVDVDEKYIYVLS